MYAHAVPVFNADKSVLKPESVKYYCEKQVRFTEEGKNIERTMGINKMLTRSSSFSTNEMAKPFS